MNDTNQHQPSSTLKDADLHLKFAEYFFKDDLKHYIWLLSKKLEEGHICVHLDEVNNLEVFNHRNAEEKNALQENFLSHHLVAAPSDQKRPFVVHNKRLYLHRYFHYESIMLRRIKAFLATEKEAYAFRINQLCEQKEVIQQLFAPERNAVHSLEKRPDWQLAAALSGVMNNFTIITGGPGTGKTTTVAKILAILFATNDQLKVALAAPTGKAAARMAESIKNATLPVDDRLAALFQSLEPSTIHRLLKAVPESHHFRHNNENPLNYDVVIIDESSMIDVALFAKLLDAIGNHTRLIMLGDKDQLASVEAGSLFGDLCQAQDTLNRFSAQRIALVNSFIADENNHIPGSQVAESEHPLFEHIIELRHSHRFTGDEGIGRFSKAVIQNHTKIINEFVASSADKQVQIDTGYSNELFEKFISGYEEFILEKDIVAALHKLNKLRVLCAVREGKHGLYHLNRQIESYLHRRGLIVRSGEFYENRPIIVTRNFYQLGLFNGDTGILRPDGNGIIKAWFEGKDGKTKPVLPGYITQAETVYAMTIHKSQGSEFDQVLVVLPDAPDLPLLTRELLYTGVTRARNSVLIQGTAEVFRKAADACVQRGSGIIERFKK